MTSSKEIRQEHRKVPMHTRRVHRPNLGFDIIQGALLKDIRIERTCIGVCWRKNPSRTWAQILKYNI